MDRLGVRGNVTCQILRPNLWWKFVRGAFAVHESITAGLLCLTNRRIYICIAATYSLLMLVQFCYQNRVKQLQDLLWNKRGNGSKYIIYKEKLPHLQSAFAWLNIRTFPRYENTFRGGW
jgi:hypothetical protein